MAFTSVWLALQSSAKWRAATLRGPLAQSELPAEWIWSTRELKHTTRSEEKFYWQVERVSKLTQEDLLVACQRGNPKPERRANRICKLRIPCELPLTAPTTTTTTITITRATCWPTGLLKNANSFTPLACDFLLLLRRPAVLSRHIRVEAFTSSSLLLVALVSLCLLEPASQPSGR